MATVGVWAASIVAIFSVLQIVLRFLGGPANDIRSFADAIDALFEDNSANSWAFYPAMIQAQDLRARSHWPVSRYLGRILSDLEALWAGSELSVEDAADHRYQVSTDLIAVKSWLAFRERWMIGNS